MLVCTCSNLIKNVLEDILVNGKDRVLYKAKYYKCELCQTAFYDIDTENPIKTIDKDDDFFQYIEKFKLIHGEGHYLKI